jgi:hypothetical protein
MFLQMIYTFDKEATIITTLLSTLAVSTSSQITSLNKSRPAAEGPHIVTNGATIM